MNPKGVPAHGQVFFLVVFFFVLLCYKNTHRKTEAWWKSCVFLSDEFKLRVSSSLELPELTDFLFNPVSNILAHVYTSCLLSCE